METLLNVSLPFFGMIFAGWGAARFKLLDNAAATGINAFVFWFALPIMLFMKMAAAPIGDAFDWRFFVTYSGGGMVAFWACVLLCRILFRSPLAHAGIQGMAAGFPNVGYMGLPILIALFGERAVIPGVLVIVFDHVILIPVTTALVEAGSGRRATAVDIIKRVLIALSRNPLIVATSLGLLLGLSGIPLPVPLTALGNLFANAAGPCALFALGASLGDRHLGAGIDEIVVMSACRLLLHPLASWVIGAAVLDLDPVLLSIAVIDASLPVAANVFVMARAYDTYTDRASATVLISTAIGVVTVSCFIAIFAPG